MEIYFQDSEYNLNGASDMAYSTFGPNYELNRLTGSLTYSIGRFIFIVSARDKGSGAGTFFWTAGQKI